MQNKMMQGMTIVEIAVSLSVATIIVIGIIPLLVHLFGVAGTSITVSKQVSELQQALNTINRDLAITKKFLGQADISEPTSHGRVPSDGLWKFNSNPKALILQLPATTKPYQDPTRDLVYNQNSGDCDGEVQPLYINIVYFQEGSTLYRRTLVPTPPQATPCPGQSISQRSTCQNGCDLKDVVILKDVHDFSIDYYQNPSDEDPDDVSGLTPGTGALSERLAVQVKITNRKQIRGSSNDYSLRTRKALVW